MGDRSCPVPSGPFFAPPFGFAGEMERLPNGPAVHLSRNPGRRRSHETGYPMMFLGCPSIHRRIFSKTISPRISMLSAVAKAAWGVRITLGALMRG